MGLLIQSIKAGDQYLDESFDPAHLTKDTAYTFPGHFAKRNPDDGIWYVRSKIEPATEEFIVDASIHEFAHFCGPLGADEVGHAMIGGQPAYGSLALGLAKSAAMKNASSYAWLAYLARMEKSKWLTSM